MQAPSALTTFLFTDIEGSTGLWERTPESMGHALARHDALARAAVETHDGVVVKATGDGMCAAFDDPLDALAAVLELQQALADPEATHGIKLAVRCGVHAGVVERRDKGHDFRETEPYAGGKIARFYLAQTRTEGIELPVNLELGRPEHNEWRWTSFDEARELLAPRLRFIVDWAESVVIRLARA